MYFVLLGGIHNCKRVFGATHHTNRYPRQRIFRLSETKTYEARVTLIVLGMLKTEKGESFTTKLKEHVKSLRSKGGDETKSATP